MRWLVEFSEPGPDAPAGAIAAAAATNAFGCQSFTHRGFFVLRGSDGALRVVYVPPVPAHRYAPDQPLADHLRGPVAQKVLAFYEIENPEPGPAPKLPARRKGG